MLMIMTTYFWYVWEIGRIRKYMSHRYVYKSWEKVTWVVSIFFSLFSLHVFLFSSYFYSHPHVTRTHKQAAIIFPDNERTHVCTCLYYASKKSVLWSLWGNMSGFEEIISIYHLISNQYFIYYEIERRHNSG